MRLLENCPLVFSKLVLISTAPGSPEHDVPSTMANTFLRRDLTIIVAVIDGLTALSGIIQWIKLYSVILCWTSQSKQMPRLMNNGLSK